MNKCFCKCDCCSNTVLTTPLDLQRPSGPDSSVAGICMDCVTDWIRKNPLHLYNVFADMIKGI